MYDKVKKLAQGNPRAACEMLTTLAAGAFAGTDELTGGAAANRALEALDRILTITEVERED